MPDYVTKPIPAAKPSVKFVERPWGSFKQYAHNQEVTVSLMTVLPGQRLSLQSHTGRAELWIVLDEGVRRMVAAGFDPATVLASCTEVPARSIGRPDLGTLAPGALADLVAWDADWHPTRVWVGGTEVAGTEVGGTAVGTHG